MVSRNHSNYFLKYFLVYGRVKKVFICLNLQSFCESGVTIPNIINFSAFFDYKKFIQNLSEHFHNLVKSNFLKY